jgi:hypothetical protein
MASNAVGRPTSGPVDIEERRAPGGCSAPARPPDLAGGPAVAGLGVAPGRLEQAVRRQHHLKVLELGRPRLPPDRRRQHRLDPLRHRQDPRRHPHPPGRRRRGRVRQARPGQRHRRRPPDIAFWYVNWLEWLRDTGHSFFGPLVAIGEVVIGICLILGLFTGIMAFSGHGPELLVRVRRLGRGQPGDDPGRRPDHQGLAQRRLGWPRPVRAPPPRHPMAPRRAARALGRTPADDHLTRPTSQGTPAGARGGAARPGQGGRSAGAVTVQMAEAQQGGSRPPRHDRGGDQP